MLIRSSDVFSGKAETAVPAIRICDFARAVDFRYPCWTGKETDMKLSTLALSATLLAISSASALAMCKGKHRGISCAEGMVYDFDKHICVEPQSS